MKLQDYRSDFHTFTGKASDLNRQLAFAGIAIIWLFKKKPLSGLTVPRGMVLPGLFIVASLTLDMLHYCTASAIWRVFYRSREKLHIPEDREIKHGVWWEHPIWIPLRAEDHLRAVSLHVADSVLMAGDFLSIAACSNWHQTGRAAVSSEG